MTQDELFKILVAHCKEYGFIFPMDLQPYMITVRWESS